MWQRLYEGDHLAVARGLSNLSITRDALGKTAEARQGLDQAVAMLRRLTPDGSPQLACALAYSGSVRVDAAVALPELEEAVAMAERFLPPDHPHLKDYREVLAMCRAVLAERGKPDAKEGRR